MTSSGNCITTEQCPQIVFRSPQLKNAHIFKIDRIYDGFLLYFFFLTHGDNKPYATWPHMISRELGTLDSHRCYTRIFACKLRFCANAHAWKVNLVKEYIFICTQYYFISINVRTGIRIEWFPSRFHWRSKYFDRCGHSASGFG